MTSVRFWLCVMTAAWAVACGDSGGDGDTSGDTSGDTAAATSDSAGADTGTAGDSAADTSAGDSDTAGPADSGTLVDGVDVTADQTIGSACSCTDAGCEMMGVPLPTGPALGCDDVPSDVAGAEVVCLRSYDGTTAPQTWFANGYCALQATACEGPALLCGSAQFGDYAAMTACPEGTVMLENTVTITNPVLGDATLQSKVCVRSCTADADCRTGEMDAVWGEEGQYQCIDKDGVQFCYDPRNLADTYTATAF